MSTANGPRAGSTYRASNHERKDRLAKRRKNQRERESVWSWSKIVGKWALKELRKMAGRMPRRLREATA